MGRECSHGGCRGICIDNLDFFRRYMQDIYVHTVREDVETLNDSSHQFGRYDVVAIGYT